MYAKLVVYGCAILTALCGSGLVLPDALAGTVKEAVCAILVGVGLIHAAHAGPTKEG